MRAAGWCFPLLLAGVALLLRGGGGGGGSASSSHSLRYFMMAVWEPGWRRPLSSSLGYVNDQLIGRYNQETGQCTPQSPWVKKISHHDTSFWARNTGWDFPSSLAVDLMMLKNLYNQSRGIHTLQVISGCKLSGDDRTPRGFVQYGYNGRDFLSLDLATLTWTPTDAEAKPIKRKWDAEHDRGKLWQHFLTDACAEGLHTHLHYGKEALQRIDPPTVRVTRKAGSEGRETLVCRLHGFYPREVEVTWKRNGEVWHHDTFHGGVVPNADRTYHTWLSVDIDPKDRDSYRCRVEHDGLPEPLDLAWEESASKVGFAVGVLLGVVAAVILLGAGVFVYIKKPREGSYETASTSEQGSESSISA